MQRETFQRIRTKQSATEKQQQEEDYSSATILNQDGNSTSTVASLRISVPPTENVPEVVIGPLTLLLLSQFLLFLGVGAVIPSIPLYGKEIGLSSAANGIVISAPAVALLLAANWGGTQADRARKPAMMLGMAIIAVSDVGTALATTLPALIFARLGLGAGRALSEAGERGMLVDLANQIPSLRGRALAAQQAVVALGITIGAPAGGVVVQQYGPRAAFLCVSAAAIVALILYAFLPETIVNPRQNSNKSNSKIETPSGPKIWMDLLRDKQWQGLALCQSGASFGFAAKIASIPILAASALPGGAAGAGALLSAAGVSGLIGAPIGGWATDRIGAKGTIILSGIVSSIGLMLVPVALAASSYEIGTDLQLDFDGVILDGTAVFFSLAVMLWSLGATAQGPALIALAQQFSAPGAEATSLSLVKAAGDGTYIIVPFLLGLFADTFSITGVECALAGSAILFGTTALAILVSDPSNSKKN
ncbi:quinolone resistance protein [Nitzschia inconspicua]|uniref:Quinolone resistance protein n=1 Tax=Nitzschia inconspicua TaxID=303405 RepID=A0A9K3L884_9STRA|nr:quinolone resistance protein [Nitzschia inconspicua]